MHGHAINVEVADGVEEKKQYGYSIKWSVEETVAFIIYGHDEPSSLVRCYWKKRNAVDYRCENCRHDPLPLQTLSAAASNFLSYDDQIDRGDDHHNIGDKYE